MKMPKLIVSAKNQRMSSVGTNETPPGELEVPNKENYKPCVAGKNIALPIYAIGHFEINFPSPGIQREYEYERASLGASNDNEQTKFHAVLTKRVDLARAMCWSLFVNGIPAYHLRPHPQLDAFVWEQLLDAIKPEADGQPAETDVIVGVKEGFSTCAGLTLPLVSVVLAYSFDAKTIVESFIEKLTDGGEKAKGSKKQITARALELFKYLRQIADNLGELPEHRVLNFIGLRFMPFYETALEMLAKNYSLASIEARPSRLSTDLQKIYDAILTFQPNFAGAIQQYFVRVDVTEIYPHVLSPGMQQFFER